VHVMEHCASPAEAVEVFLSDHRHGTDCYVRTRLLTLLKLDFDSDVVGWCQLLISFS